LAGVAEPVRTSSGEVTIAILRGMIRGVPPEEQTVMQENFQAVLKQQTGLEGRLVVIATAESLRKQLADGSIDLGAFSGVEFAWMKEKKSEFESLMLAMPNPDALQAVVVVAKESSLQKVNDLIGKKLAISNKVGDDARLFLLRLAAKPGATIEKEFPGTYA